MGAVEALRRADAGALKDFRQPSLAELAPWIRLRARAYDGKDASKWV